MRAIHVANVPKARVYYIIDGEEGGNDGAVVLPNEDPMFVNFWSFAERKRHLEPITNTKFHKFFWDGHKGDEADRWNNIFLERLIKPDAEMLSSVPIVTKFPNIKKERNNARSNHASEFKSLTGAGHHEKALGRRGRGLGRGIGRVGRGATSVFDPKAWDGDGDGIVQERTPYERPAIPGINTNLPGVPHTRTKPADYPDDHRDPIGERPPAPQEKPDISRMQRFKPEGAVGEHPSLIPTPGRRAERMARRTEPSSRRQGLRSSMDPHGPPGTGSDKDPRGGTYPPPKPFDVWRRHPNRTALREAIDRRVAALRGPDHYEKTLKRSHARVDKRLNDGQPIKTIADAKRVMGAVNSSFLSGPNGESPRSEASFLGPREILSGVVRNTLGRVVFRDDDEELSEHDRNFMYSWLTQSIDTGRYDLTNWSLISKAEHDRRADNRVRDLNDQPYPAVRHGLGYVGYAPASRGAWRNEERGPELGELLGDEDAPLFAAGTMPQGALEESVGYIKPSGSGYVINETGRGRKVRDKPTLMLMYSSEPEVIGPSHPSDDRQLIYEFTDAAGNVTEKKIYGSGDYFEPKEAMQTQENVALGHFASVMTLLEDDANRTQEEIDTKDTDGAIAPLPAYDARKYTKRYMRMYKRARTLMHHNVGQHELGHANHFLAMLEDFSKRAGALSGRKIDYKKLSEFMASGFHKVLSKKKKRRLVEFTATRAIHEAKNDWEDDIFGAITRVLGRMTTASPGAGQQSVLAEMRRIKATMDAPIYDEHGKPLERTAAIKKLLKQSYDTVNLLNVDVPFFYDDPSDDNPHHPGQNLLTRGDLYFLLGPSLHQAAGQGTMPDGTQVYVPPQFYSPLGVHDPSIVGDRANKHGNTAVHEPWGMLDTLFDRDDVINTGWDASPLGTKIPVSKLTVQAWERLREHGLPKFEHAQSSAVRIDAVDADTIDRLLLASGRVAGQLPTRGHDHDENVDRAIDVDPKAPIKLESVGDIDSETLLRSLLGSHAPRYLSDREIDDTSKTIIEGTVERSTGAGKEPLREILKAKQLIQELEATGGIDRDTANELIKEVVPQSEKPDWPLMLMVANDTLGSGLSFLGLTNPETGNKWAIGDTFPAEQVKKMIAARARNAQDHLSGTFETFGLLSEFYDDLDEKEIDILTDISKRFGGTRHTAYMGKRYPAVDGTTYATDGTRQEIMSELNALIFSGEKIMLEVSIPGSLKTKFVPLSAAQQAVVDKLMKWMKPVERWGPDDA